MKFKLKQLRSILKVLQFTQEYNIWMLSQSKLRQIQTTKQVLAELKKVFEIRKTARFWFGTLLSISQQIVLPHLQLNCNQHQMELLFAMLSFAVMDVTAFYQHDIPEEVYHLLEIIEFLFTKVEEGQAEQCRHNYRIIMQKLHYYNVLGVLMMKNKQYSMAEKCYEHILDKYYNGSVQTASQIFLSAFNNYLFLIKTSPSLDKSDSSKNPDDERIKTLQSLQTIILQLVTRYLIRQQPLEQSCIVLLSIFNQHQFFFSEETRALCIKLFNKNKKQSYRKQSPLPQQSYQHDQQYVDRLLLKKYLKENSKSKVTTMKIKSKELGFFVRFNKSLGKKQSGRLRAAKQSRTVRAIELEPISKELFLEENLVNTPKKIPIKGKKALDQSMSFMTDRNIHYSSSIIPTIRQSVSNAPGSFHSSQIHVKAEKSKEKLNFSQDQPLIYRDFIAGVKRAVVLKNSFVLLRYVSQGMVLENYLSEKQKFLSWNDLGRLLKFLKTSLIFKEVLPIGISYQLSHIFLNYLQKKQPTYENKRTVLLSDSPHELVYINELVHIYKQQGPFIKILVMNLYDANHTQIELDCYIDYFDHFFKKIKNNEYIEWLSKLLMSQKRLAPNICDQEEFSAEFYRKDKNISRQEIEIQFKIDKIRDLQEIKSKSYSILVLMKNNKTLLFCLDDNFESKVKSPSQKYNLSNIVFKVVDVSSPEKRPGHLIIPYHKFIKYFPVKITNFQEIMSQIHKIIQNHGKMVIQPYLHCFTDYPQSFYLRQNMNMKTYAKKVEIVKQGRYYAPISVQIIGTDSRIIGLVFREYEQTIINEVVTLVYNQSYDFMRNITKQKLTQQRRKIILSRMLINGSVKQSIQQLRKANWRGTIVGMFQYLNILPQEQSLTPKT